MHKVRVDAQLLMVPCHLGGKIVLVHAKTMEVTVLEALLEAWR